MRKFLSGLALVALSPLLLVVCLVILFLLPFRIFSYKRSPWYKERGEKYTFGINSALYYKMYNISSKKGLPLTYQKEGDYHFFLWEDRLLFPLSDYVEEVMYDEKEGRFEFLILSGEAEEKEVVPISCYLEGLLKELGRAAEGKEVLLILPEDALGDHVKEGRDVFLSYTDKRDLRGLLRLLCEKEEQERTAEQDLTQEEN